MESRGFERESRTGMSLRMEFEGALEAVSVSVVEVFSGRTRSADWAARFAACLLLCGGSSSIVGDGGLSAVVGCCSILSVDPMEFESETMVVIFPLLALARARSSTSFPEKYPARHVDPIPAALRADLPEKVLVTVDFVPNKQDIHTVPRPLDRRALTGEDRIIIACGKGESEALEDVSKSTQLQLLVAA